MPAAALSRFKLFPYLPFKSCSVKVTISELLSFLRFCCTNEYINRIRFVPLLSLQISYEVEPSKIADIKTFCPIKMSQQNRLK